MVGPLAHSHLLYAPKQTNTLLLVVLPNIDEKTTQSRMKLFCFESAEFISDFK